VTKRNPLPAPDLKDLQALADWLVSMAFVVEDAALKDQKTVSIECGQVQSMRLSDHAANIRRAIARLKQKDDATAQPQDWGKDE
jgi:hypothetical protein